MEVELLVREIVILGGGLFSIYIPINLNQLPRGTDSLVIKEIVGSRTIASTAECYR
jgi:hypothetical protein